MTVMFSPVAGGLYQAFDNNGLPLVGGKLYTYANGTTTPIAVYTSSTGGTAHTNPIILDSSGRIPSGGEIWITSQVLYTFVLKDANDNLIKTVPDISAGFGSTALVNTIKVSTDSGDPSANSRGLIDIAYVDPSTEAEQVPSALLGNKQIVHADGTKLFSCAVRTPGIAVNVPNTLSTWYKPIAYYGIIQTGGPSYSGTITTQSQINNATNRCGFQFYAAYLKTNATVNGPLGDGAHAMDVVTDSVPRWRYLSGGLIPLYGTNITLGSTIGGNIDGTPVTFNGASQPTARVAALFTSIIDLGPYTNGFTAFTSKFTYLAQDIKWRTKTITPGGDRALDQQYSPNHGITFLHIVVDLPSGASVKLTMVDDSVDLATYSSTDGGGTSYRAVISAIVPGRTRYMLSTVSGSPTLVSWKEHA